MSEPSGGAAGESVDRTPTGAVSAPAARRGLYPELEPYASGLLAVGDGNEIYWEEAGNPAGKPVVFVHGGPGGGVSGKTRRFFDPARYRIVQFDQRNCGRSTPHASTGAVDWAANTTWHLIGDLEALREARGVERWQVFGGSWGSTLGLAYAEAHPDRVTELVLRGVFTLRRSELDWYYNGGARQLAPEWGERFVEPVRRWASERGPAADDVRDVDCIAAYHDLLFDPDPAVHGPAGVAWTTWEAATSSLHFDPVTVAHYADPSFALAFARIENHYFFHAGWLREGQLIAEVDAIRHIPAVIVQGAFDLCCPPVTAWDLHRAWSEAEFHLVHAGHSSWEPEITDRLVRATDAFAG